MRALIDFGERPALYAALEKVKIDSPRGPWVMSKAHNPIQDIYICQVVAKGDGISTKILATSKDVTDPGKKIY